jgi:hypothetical protein
MIHEDTHYSISAELIFARGKFPGNEDQLAVLSEEVGELASALIDQKHGNGSGADVYAEAIQVAAMAIRIAEEGSKEFPYKYKHEYHQVFNDARPISKI